jgi:hypothetical protein
LIQRILTEIQWLSTDVDSVDETTMTKDCGDYDVVVVAAD